MSMMESTGRQPPRLNQSARIAGILTLLDGQPFWSVGDLARRFDVSEETIRRDVRQLELGGHVQKTHGGVSLPNHMLEGPFRQRVRIEAALKQRIARRAAEFIQPGMTILLDSGTSAFWLARALQGLRDLTIITNSVEIAQEVTGRSGQRLFMAGGEISPHYGASFGPEAISYCRRFVPDITVFSIGSIDETHGYLDFDAGEATFKRALIENARRLMILADSTKFARGGRLQVAQHHEVHDLVTDSAPPAGIAQAAGAGTQVHIA